MMTKNLGFEDFVLRWQKASKPLQDILDRELKEANIQKEIALLAPLFDLAVKNNPPEPYSGLVEMQKGFKIWHERRNRK